MVLAAKERLVDALRSRCLRDWVRRTAQPTSLLRLVHGSDAALVWQHAAHQQSRHRPGPSPHGDVHLVEPGRPANLHVDDPGGPHGGNPGDAFHQALVFLHLRAVDHV